MKRFRKHTLVDLYRCWELWTLTAQASKLGGVMLEVGVWRGGTGALIAKRARQIPTYLCDTSRGVVKASEKEDTAHLLGDQPIALCHIDVDTYLSARDIVQWVWPRLVPGGIIVYDDFGTVNLDGVRVLVEEQIDCVDRIVLHNLNSHAIVIKR